MIFILLACDKTKDNNGSLYELSIHKGSEITCASPIDDNSPSLYSVYLDVNTPEMWTLIQPDPPTYASGGVILLDADADQDIDILSFSQTQPHLFINDGNGSFVENNDRLPILPEAFYNGGSAADFDNDGDADIYLSTSEQPDVFLEQQTDGFINRSTDIGIDQSDSYSAAAAWADMDLDGDLDLMVSGYGNDIIIQSDGNFDDANPSYLYVNNENQFSIHPTLPPIMQPEPFTFSASWLPLDNTPPLDVLMANDLGPFVHPNTAHINDGTNWSQINDDAGLNQEMFSMGLAITDWDADALPDILITNIGDPLFLSSNNGMRVDITQSIGLVGTDEQITSWGALWFDINNDAQEDLWVGYGPLPLNDTETGPPNPPEQPDRILLRNNSQLVDVATNWGLDRRSNTRGGAMADLNNDGFVDMVRKPIDGPPEIFMNQCNGNNWISITLQDELGHRSAVGSHLTLHTTSSIQKRWVLAGGTSFMSSFPGTSYFGLGTETSIKQVIIEWPDGRQDTIQNLPINRHITVHRIPMTSQ